MAIAAEQQRKKREELTLHAKCWGIGEYKGLVVTCQWVLNKFDSMDHFSLAT